MGPANLGNSLITPPVHKRHDCRGHCSETAQCHRHDLGYWLIKIRCRPPFGNVFVTFCPLVRPCGMALAIPPAYHPGQPTRAAGQDLHTHKDDEMIYTAPGQAGALVSFKPVTTTSSGATGWPPAPVAISRTSRRWMAGCSVRWPDPTPPTLSWRWMPPTRRSPAGARPASPSAATCCCASPIASSRT